MKEVTVDISKTYALRSETGGEVMDANSKPLETLEANKQKHMTAQESVWLVPDDCKVTKTNFKSALAALGLLGGGESSGLPAGYTRVEYLESTGKQIIHTNIQYIYPAYYDIQFFKDGRLQFMGYSDNKAKWGKTAKDNYRLELQDTNIKAGKRDFIEVIKIIGKPKLCINVSGQSFKVITEEENEHFLWSIFGVGSKVEYYCNVRVWAYYHLDANRKKVFNGIPCLDRTGTPCLYDTITRTPFYNSGTGDFTYPGFETASAQATTYSLRALRRPRLYAQMTPHGIRRLYHVPKGYNGTPEEYAAEHGFKVLVETPAPEEGYWAPVWHEREDCIELEWVETEPPEEQELLTETE